MWDPFINFIPVHQKELWQRLMVVFFCMTHKGQTAEICGITDNRKGQTQFGVCVFYWERWNAKTARIGCYTMCRKHLSCKVKENLCLIPRHMLDIRLSFDTIRHHPSQILSLKASGCDGFPLDLLAVSGYLTGFRFTPEAVKRPSQFCSVNMYLKMLNFKTDVFCPKFTLTYFYTQQSI